MGDDQAKQLEAAKSCMAEEQNLVASRLAETSKELGKVVEEKEELERQMRALTEKVLEKENHCQLQDIKKKCDPTFPFCYRHCVGSEVGSQPLQS